MAINPPTTTLMNSIAGLLGDFGVRALFCELPPDRDFFRDLRSSREEDRLDVLRLESELSSELSRLVRRFRFRSAPSAN